jgi:hypothetical protein
MKGFISRKITTFREISWVGIDKVCVFMLEQRAKNKKSRLKSQGSRFREMVIEWWGLIIKKLLHRPDANTLQAVQELILFQRKVIFE